MKKHLFILTIIIFILMITGEGSLQVSRGQELVVSAPKTNLCRYGLSRTVNNSAAPSDTKLIQQVVDAHITTLTEYASAFQAEYENREKKPWKQVRTKLLNYWSPQMVDGPLEQLYTEHLWDWGYELGFAFPLHNPDTIESAVVLTHKENKTILQFLAPVDYDTQGIIRVTLIQQNDQWVIHSAVTENKSGSDAFI